MTVIVLTTTGSSTFTIPSDWNNASNTIECLGGGGNGAGASISGWAGGGGAAGNYAKKNNASYTPGTVVNIRIAPGGGNSNNVSGGTWFDGTAVNACVCGAGSGTDGAGNSSGGSLSPYTTGDVTYSGGGGAGNPGNSVGGGGGGAAGPNGAGTAGTLGGAGG